MCLTILNCISNIYWLYCAFNFLFFYYSFYCIDIKGKIFQSNILTSLFIKLFSLKVTSSMFKSLGRVFNHYKKEASLYKDILSRSTDDTYFSKVTWQNLKKDKLSLNAVAGVTDRHQDVYRVWKLGWRHSGKIRWESPTKFTLKHT